MDLNLNFGDYEKRGLYLILKDSSRLEMTEEHITELTKKYWEDPKKIPEAVKDAVDFKRCDFCPIRDEGGICDAIRPLLPFIDQIEKFVSFDPAVAIFKGRRKDILRLSDTTMQNALNYLSTLSLMSYCKSAHKFRKYFYGVNPLMSAKEASSRIYLNISWDHKCDKGTIDKIISEFKSTIRSTTENQVKRLNLICTNDVLSNALVKTQTIIEFLSLDYDKLLEESFKKIELEA